MSYFEKKAQFSDQTISDDRPQKQYLLDLSDVEDSRGNLVSHQLPLGNASMKISATANLIHKTRQRKQPATLLRANPHAIVHLC